MRRLTLFASACVLAACSPSSLKSHDLSTGPDLAASIVNLTGAMATEFKLDISAGGGDGGAGTASTLTVLGEWNVDEPLTPNPDGTYSVLESWHLCQLDIPEGLHLPYDDAGLARIFANAPSGTITGLGDGSRFTQAPFAIVGGAQLLDGLNDTLPNASAQVCSGTVGPPCVSPNYVTKIPGVRVQASGLLPDADVLYVDFRVVLSFQATAHLDGTLNGMVDSAKLDSHVLSCHLRSGAMCSASDVATIEASKPAIAITGGTLRSHLQGTYFQCPQMIADPNGSVTGIELQDGGMIDASTSTMSFGLVQSDLDQRGCATCHENRTAPGQLHLVLQPWTDELVRSNYQSALPFTLSSSMQGLPGGRLVNQTPIPGPMRDRWLQWIKAGAPF